MEGAGDSAESRLAARGDESQKTRTRLEDGKIIVDVYDGDGRLLKRTPPGYLPFGEIA